MTNEQIKTIRNITDFEPEIAIILGSGLGELGNKIEKVAEVDYKDIPNMPISTAPGHKGKFIFGNIEGKKVVLMQGRIHLYEGYSPQQILIPIRIIKGLGVKTIILTNAAGGINKELNVGDFVLIKDHISCFIDSPLIGKNDDSFGPRFPDMSKVYGENIRKIAKEVALKNNITLHEGVYVQLKGPQFETPAEIQMLSAMGADVVGMSTVVEAIASVHCGLNVCGISMVSNMACGILDKPLSSEEVIEAGAKSAEKFEKLIKGIIKEL